MLRANQAKWEAYRGRFLRPCRRFGPTPAIAEVAVIDLSYASSRSRWVVAATVVGSEIAMLPTVVRHPDRRLGRGSVRSAQDLSDRCRPLVPGCRDDRGCSTLGGRRDRWVGLHNPEVFSRAFGNAMAITAVIAAAGSVVAWFSATTLYWTTHPSRTTTVLPNRPRRPDR